MSGLREKRILVSMACLDKERRARRRKSEKTLLLRPSQCPLVESTYHAKKHTLEYYFLSPNNIN
jgi:hypothetical protein